MKDKSGAVVRSGGAPVPKTSHTLNPVPFWAYDAAGRLALRPSEARRGIASVGTTLVELFGIPAPEGYDPGLLVPNP